MKGWRGWYHCVLTTYGAWLPGDERGFRTRDHREHVEGDYRKPPPKGKYSSRLDGAERQMSRGVVVLDARRREVVCRALREKLEALGVVVRIVAVGRTHAHLLVRFEPKRLAHPGIAMPGLRKMAELDYRWVRRVLGVAKKHVSIELRQAGLAVNEVGGIWGAKGRSVPIVDQAHGKSVVAYIRWHAGQGAVVWERPK